MPAGISSYYARALTGISYFSSNYLVFTGKIDGSVKNDM